MPFDPRVFKVHEHRSVVTSIQYPSTPDFGPHDSFVEFSPVFNCSKAQALGPGRLGNESWSTTYYIHTPVQHRRIGTEQNTVYTIPLHPGPSVVSFHTDTEGYQTLRVA